jgi:mannitol/fructose-specific phosphotransferase system IIA component (Ntr-type)
MANNIEKTLHKAIIIKSSERMVALDELMSHLLKSKNVGNPQAINRIIKDREESMSSGIGSGIAVPHVRHADIKKITVVVGLSFNGIGWLSPDYAPVNFVCLIAAPDNVPDTYLDILGSYLSKLRDNKFRNKLMKTRKEVELKNLWLGKSRQTSRK